jgi:hypothetical protein
MLGIGIALDLETNRDTEYFKFCESLKVDLVKRLGQMPKVLDQIMAQQGYVRSQIPENLLRYLSDAGLKEGEICDELRSYQM